MEKFLNVLPIIMMIESIIASFILFYYGRYGSGLYWFSASIIAYCIIFGIKRYG